jgi:hypothetical protein
MDARHGRVTESPGWSHMKALCETSKPRYARRQRPLRPWRTGQKPLYLGSIAGRALEFPDELPPAARLGFFDPVRDQHSQTSFTEGVDNLSASDPDSTKRTWSALMAEFRSHGRAGTQLRYDRTMRIVSIGHGTVPLTHRGPKVTSCERPGRIERMRKRLTS